VRKSNQDTPTRFTGKYTDIMLSKNAEHQLGPDGRKIYVPQHKKPPGKLAGVRKVLHKLSPASLFAKKPKPLEARSIMVNQTLPTGPEWRDKKGKVVRDKVYPTNQNITSKYTVITFLPRNLFEQFRRIANGESINRIGHATLADDSLSLPLTVFFLGKAFAALYGIETQI
jgi:hypothetical protein